MIFIITGDDEKAISNWLFVNKDTPCVTFKDRHMKYILKEIKDICKEFEDDKEGKEGKGSVIIKTFNPNIIHAFFCLQKYIENRIVLLYSHNGEVTITTKEEMTKTFESLINPTDALFLGTYKL